MKFEAHVPRDPKRKHFQLFEFDSLESTVLNLKYVLLVSFRNSLNQSVAMGICTSKPQVLEDESSESSSSVSKTPSDIEFDTLFEGPVDADSKKIKLLLLGAGESGKSTIFKQMRILYGSPKTDDDLRMYGVVVRSNIITAVRKLCRLTRELGLEKSLDEESAQSSAADFEDMSGMTPREAFDEIMAHLVEFSANEPFPDISKAQAEQDWVGDSKRAGIQANKDARQFLQHVEAIRVLWQVSS